VASDNDDVHIDGSVHMSADETILAYMSAEETPAPFGTSDETRKYDQFIYGKMPLGHRVFFNVGTGKRTVEYIGLFPWGICADCGQPSKFMIVEMQSETEIKTRAPYYKTWLYCGMCQVGG